VPVLLPLLVLYLLPYRFAVWGLILQVLWELLYPLPYRFAVWGSLFLLPVF
jgi:hypothetical protein